MKFYKLCIGVKTTFPHHMVGQLFLNILLVNQNLHLSRHYLKTAPTSTETHLSVGPTVWFVVWERLCIECWFNL